MTDTLAFNRREFLSTSTLGALVVSIRSKKATSTSGKPNILLILTDQQHIDTISALGTSGSSTPNMDRLVQQGTTFTESYCTGALCSPARSSIFTGRMPCETGVYRNSVAIRDDIPTLGSLLKSGGYDTYFAGKWHLPDSYPWEISDFKVLATGITGQGHYCDSMITRACEELLLSRQAADAPFFLFAGYLQPHDICQFGNLREGILDDDQFAGLEDELLPLPPNHHSIPTGEDGSVANMRETFYGIWSDRLWQYYNWGYNRMVEQVDAEIGRLIDTLEQTGLDQNTLVIFTSDHGEGRGRHGLVTKNFLYEDAIKVPTVVSFPGKINAGQKDSTHLVSGVDIMPTICDYAGITPPQTCGLSLRPFLEGRPGPTHPAVVTETRLVGRSVRSANYKYINYFGEPDAIQLFDLRSDPWETENLATNPQYRTVLDEHLNLLRNWEAALDPVPEIRVPWEVAQEQAGTMVAQGNITLEGTVFSSIQTTGGIFQSNNNEQQPQFSIDRRILPLTYTISFTPAQDGIIKVTMPIYRGPVTITEFHIAGGLDAPNEIAAMTQLPGTPWSFPNGAEWLADPHGIRLTKGQKLICNQLNSVKEGVPVKLYIKLV